MSDYQPRQQGGWPQQPPRSNAGQGGNDQPGGYGSPQPGQPGWTPQGYPQSQRRRRRRHPLRWLTVTLVVIIVILVVGDQVGKAVAEHEFVQKIESSSGLNVKPSVTIEESLSSPFLAQLAAKDFKVVDISTGAIKSGDYEITSVKARATGMHLSSLSSSASVRVDHITGTATIAYSSLNNDLGKAVGIAGALTISPDPSAGKNFIEVQTAGGIGSVTAQVEKTGPQQITIHFGSLGGIAALLNGAASIPDQVINIPKLPAGLVINSIDVTNQGIVATASASNTTLSQ